MISLDSRNGQVKVYCNNKTIIISNHGKNGNLMDLTKHYERVTSFNLIVPYEM
jgi:hypothetical protein